MVLILDQKLQRAIDKEIAKQTDRPIKRCVYCGKALRSHNKSYMCQHHKMKHLAREKSIKKYCDRVHEWCMERTNE